MSTQIVPELDSIERFLRTHGWHLQRLGTVSGETEYLSANGEWNVELTKEGYWSLGKFTDGDRYVSDGRGGELLMAMGRFESVEEGDALAEFEAAMVSLGVIPWSCPNCGEEGGEPRTSYSRELYGADYDGNRGEWREYEEECCSKCIGVSR